MKMKKGIIILASVLIALGIYGGEEKISDIKSGFANPPTESLPRAWWHWINGNISKEGITADLEAMHKMGLGSATILDVSCSHFTGDVETLSPKWYEYVNFAINEAARLGMEITVSNCQGWSSSGGPWIKPENGMKNIAWTEAYVEGGKRVNVKLARAKSKGGFYKDIVVLAYPSISGDGEVFRDKISNVAANFEGAETFKVPAYMPDYIKVTQNVDDLLSANWQKVVMFTPKSAKKDGLEGDNIVFEFPKPSNVGGFKVALGGPPYSASVIFNIYVSDDGKNFRKHFTTAPIKIPGAETGFPLVKTKFVKVELADSADRAPASLYNMSLSPAVKIADLDLKTFEKWGTIPVRKLPGGVEPIKKDSIKNISEFMDADGNLVWDAPEGRWTILRFGMVATGKANHPASKAGTGLECDKMSKAGIDAAWSGMMSRIIADAGKNVGKTLSATLIDSYEVGPQNWTDEFPAEFRELRGYDIIKNLPIITGRFVESADYSERFLQDFRRTIADLFAKYYGKYFSEVVHKSGLQFVSEPYGGPFDEFLQGRYADIPMGEFWSGWNQTGNARIASNVAQIHGRKFVQTETFTSGDGEEWRLTPTSHKVQGDHAFVDGVTRFVFHSYVHQPYENLSAGMTLSNFGFHFNRLNTLWNLYDGWLSYVGKAQYLLQQGRFVAAGLYIAPEEVPTITPLTQLYAPADFYCGVDLYAPRMPFGYESNVCEPLAVFDNISVENGKIVLKSGMTYDILVANNTKQISPELLERIRSFAEQGATVLLGQRPQSSRGLTGYPQSNARVAQLADELWGGLDGAKKVSKKIGKGRVYFGVKPEFILKELGIKPDFAVSRRDGKSPIDYKYIHRKTDTADIYFVANQAESGRTVVVDAEFAAQSAAPEFWDAETGKIVPVPVWKSADGRTVIPMQLAPMQSVFVVFDKNAKPAKHLDGFKWTAAAKSGNRLAIEKALWRSKDGSKVSDITDFVRSKVKDDSLKINVDSQSLGGDCAAGLPKVLEIFYSVDGERKTALGDEWRSLEIKVPSLSESGLPEREFDVESRGGVPTLRAWVGGNFSGAGAKQPEIAVESVPAKIDLSRGWSVKPQSSDIKKFRMKKLESLSKNADEKIKYFSGTTVYKKKFDLPAQLLDGKTALELDLGVVRDIARVKLNGREVCNLWYPPYKCEITDFAKSGENELEIEVANTWFNRFVGDTHLPEDSEWIDGGGKKQFLKKLPEWLLKGGKSPTGRKAHASFRRDLRGREPIDAGLIGPVSVRPSVLVPLM